ncbi:hypothetical protein EV421DRAFT_1739265 [Armillaria borealis]|uniref:Uncharacterized protein n=1 Tax=Armillaria borealis TaxID=47425 RepID=A0AA39J7W0_9AGAR|nr:hypothetical protein EV421DRAFT_1739265 [Armillaria borealis]
MPDNTALFEGLMLMWDEAHQAAKEVKCLTNRIEKLEEALEVLLEKDSGNDLGIADTGAVADIQQGKDGDRGGGEASPSTPYILLARGPDPAPEKFDPSEQTSAGTQTKIAPERTMFIDISNDKPVAGVDKGKACAKTPLFELSDGEDEKGRVMKEINTRKSCSLRTLHAEDCEVIVISDDEDEPEICQPANSQEWNMWHNFHRVIKEANLTGLPALKFVLLFLSTFPQQFSMADTSMTLHSKNKHNPEEMDPQWKSYPLKRKQSQVFDKKVPIYLDEYRRLNPQLVSWKQIKQEDQNTLVALQNSLIHDIFNHACFDKGNLIDLNMHSRKQWEDNFCKGFKNHADHLKNIKSSETLKPRMDSSEVSPPLNRPKPAENPHNAKHMADAIHKLAKMLRFSGSLTGHAWFELEKKANIKALLAEKHRARHEGGSEEAGEDTVALDLENPGREYQLMDQKVKKIEHSVAEYMNTVNSRTLQEMVTSREVGETLEEHKHAWGSRLAREATMILPEVPVAVSKGDDFPLFVVFDKTKCTPDQWAKIAPEKFYDRKIHKFPVPIHNSSITPYTTGKCIMLLEYLERENMPPLPSPPHNSSPPPPSPSPSHNSPLPPAPPLPSPPCKSPPAPVPPVRCSTPKMPKNKASDLEPLTPEEDLESFLTANPWLEQEKEKEVKSKKLCGRGGKKTKTVAKKKAGPAKKAGSRDKSPDGTPPPKCYSGDRFRQDLTSSKEE